MNIAILGSSGFLGRNLSQRLLVEGHDVTGFVLEIPKSKIDGMRYQLISRLLESSKTYERDFDVSINLAARRSTKAAFFSPAEVHDYSFRIPKEFFLKTATPQSLIINTSTYIQNFEGVTGRTVDAYGASKQELTKFLELESHENSFRVLDLFLFTVYGPGDRQAHLVPTLIESAFSGVNIDLSPGYQLMNLLHIQDLVENMTRALTFRSTEKYVKHNLWNEDYFSVRELVSIIEKTTKNKVHCKWGGREYAGHEMFQPWPVPMELFPEFKVKISLEEGIKHLWTIRQ